MHGTLPPRRLAIIARIPVLTSVLTLLPIVMHAGELGAVGIPTFVWEVGGFESPVAIALNASGTVFVLDAGCRCVKSFDPDGTPAGSWGSFGSGDGQFDTPTDIAIDAAGTVYVTDRGIEGVQKFLLNGSFLGRWGEPGFDPGQFDEVRSISIGSDGTVFVLDGPDGRVQKFDPNGTLLGFWSASLPSGAPTVRSPADHILYPQRLEVDSMDRVYLTYLGFGVSDVVGFSADGSVLGSLSSPEQGSPPYQWAYGMGSDAVGRRYVTDVVRNKVSIFDPAGTILVHWGGPGSGPGEFASPGDVTGTVDATIYVVDTGNRRLQKFNASSVPAKLTSWGRIKAAYR